MLKNGPISLSARVFMPSDMHTNVIPAQWQKHGVDKCGHGFKKAHNKDYNLIFFFFFLSTTKEDEYIRSNTRTMKNLVLQKA